MKVTVERIPESQVLLNIEIDPERVESSIDQAYKRLAPRTRIPGFRPGKAPRALVERHYGRETLLHEALDRLVPAVVQEAIEAERIDWVDRPELEISSLDPVIVKATVPVRPTVDLGDYRSLRVERQPVEVEPEKMIPDLRNTWLEPDSQRRQMDALQALNRNFSESFGDDEYLEGRMEPGVFIAHAIDRLCAREGQQQVQTQRHALRLTINES